MDTAEKYAQSYQKRLLPGLLGFKRRLLFRPSSARSSEIPEIPVAGSAEENSLN